MKSCVLLVLVTAAAAAAAGPSEEPVRFYHEAEGIPEAARLRRREQARAGNRITGGESLTPGGQPHLGGLLISLEDGRTSLCGCSMLSSTRALTAAHCWWDGRHRARRLTVVYGSSRLYSGGTRVTTDTVQSHQNYNSYTLHNDIAIISHVFVEYSRTIKPVKLPSGSQLNIDYARQIATAAGYGRTRDNQGIGPNQEQRQVDMPVISNAECAAVFGTGTVTAATLCTSGAGGRSVCSGDSGGPLTVGEGDNRILIGVSCFVSTSGCTRSLPAGFVRVTSYVSWIEQRL